MGLSGMQHIKAMLATLGCKGQSRCLADYPPCDRLGAWGLILQRAPKLPWWELGPRQHPPGGYVSGCHIPMPFPYYHPFYAIAKRTRPC